VERILESEAWQRQVIGRGLARGAVRVGARRALKGDRAHRILRGCGAHPLDHGERGGGEALHRSRALSAPRAMGKNYGLRLRGVPIRAARETATIVFLGTLCA